MKCNRCGRSVPDSEAFYHLGEELCEDCYIDVRSPGKACDPWAVYTATRSREATGQTGTEGLTQQQRDVYEFIREKGKVSRTDVMGHFGISLAELQIIIATLRHCELVKGRKEGSNVYLVPFEYQGEAQDAYQ